MMISVRTLENFTRERKFLRRMVYIHISAYQYMGGWEKFEEPKLLAKNAFYSRLNMKAIGNQDHQNKKLV